MASRSLSEGYRIGEYVGLDAMRSLRPLWERWQTHPNADFDFFLTIVNSRPYIVNPIALVIFEKDIPVALAACRLEKVKLPISFGYMKVSRGEILQLTVDYGGLMGAWDATGAEIFIHHLRQSMRLNHIDAVYFAVMRNHHPVWKAAHLLAPFPLRDIVLRDNLHWQADLPGVFDTILLKINRKHRAQLRNKERKLVEHFNGTLQVKIFQEPEEISAFCISAEKIARSTYLRGIGEGFYDNAEMRNRLDLTARKGWMRGFVLYGAEKPCAFWLGTLYHQTFYLDYTGFDPDLKDFAAGQILFIKMIESLCSEGGIHNIDFGFGDAEYKQRYGDRNWKESDLYLFNTTPAMLLTNATRKITSLLRMASAKILKRFNLFTRIKKRWRLSAEQAVSEHKNSERDNE